MKYCQHCAGPTSYVIPQGDDRHRHYCPACDIVFYQNPRNVVGAIPASADGRVLLCKRGIEPRHGKWTLPAGFMENGESTHAGALRETMEEAGARIELGASTLYTLFNLPQIDQVYLLFRASILEMNLGFTEETLEAKLFTEAEIPWNEIAFPVVKITLEHYFRDVEAQRFPVRMFDVTRNGRELDVRLISES
ncbi:MAG: NUDIX hydrolase [Gammaproteobacteria bacterium]|nr:NUDIX hydrolase [Gammaproteobacteria bacterium]MYE30303.1 NUDIX hydrolase [Gammaproteobacteria bacterium]MYI02253.1 NUDIX hydrolase [Gammaproteobacteria bacterium]